MNLLNISNEIKKINTTLDFLKNQHNHLLNNYSNNSHLFSITDDIKTDINEIQSKIDQLYNFNIQCKFNYDTTNYDEIKQFLESINIDNSVINKFVFLNFKSLNEIILADEELFEKLDIETNTIHMIKHKIQEKIYISSIEL